MINLIARFSGRRPQQARATKRHTYALIMLGLSGLFWQGVAQAQVPSPVKIELDPLPADMKPYTETIPGTQLKIEMVPVPGGTYWIGSPEGEAKRKKDEGPQRPIRIEPFWMSKHEIIWDIYDTYSFSLDIKRKKNDGVDLEKQSEKAKAADAVTRPTPPYADMTFGMGHDNQPAICMTHHSAMECTRWLSTPARPIACRPKPSGNMQRAPAAGRPFRSATIRRGCRSTHGSATTPKGTAIQSVRASRMHSVCMTCSATSGSTASAVTDPRGATSGSYRVQRGCHWGYFGDTIRASNRGVYGAAGRFGNIGFRVVRSAS